MESSLQAYDSISDRIRHHVQGDRRPVMVVEGPSDRRMVTRLEPDVYSTFIAGTRNTVIEVVQLLFGEVDQLVGVVDRDFDDVVESVQQQGFPIFAVDASDLEAQLIEDASFVDLIDELASMTKLERVGGCDTFRALVVSGAAKVGALRRHNSHHELGWDFKAVDLTRKIDKNTLALHDRPYCQSLVEGELEQIEVAMTVLARPPACHERADGHLRPEFRGRDALAFVSVALTGLVATRRRQDVAPESLASTLRLTAHQSKGVQHMLRRIAAFISKDSN